MSLDTANRQTDRGRRIRVYAGEEGPLPGVQAFEVTQTEAIERFGEYDSEEQAVDVQIPETNGFIELLDSEKMDFWRALLAQSADVVDVRIGDFSSPWIVCNVWDKRRTRYAKSCFVKKPVFNTHPYTTTLNDAVMLRFEFSASLFVKMPQHGTAIDEFEITAGETSVTVPFAKTPAKLMDGTYVLGACERYILGTVNGVTKYEYRELAVTSSTGTTNCVLARTNGLAFEANTHGLLYYAYVSANETAAWPGVQLES